MTTPQMHTYFRQYAQQMGLQNTRAILPEQIDILINTSITDTVNQLIRENIGITNDRVITDNSKIAQINAFRTLYDVSEVLITTGEEESESIRFSYNPKNRIKGLLKHTGKYEGQSEESDTDSVFGKYMFLVDISINYKVKNSEDDEGIITAWYPVRIIDSAYLADSLNDFILKNRFRSPIACIYNTNTLELYIDKFVNGSEPIIQMKSGTSTLQIIPYELRIDTIQYPKKVKFLDDILGQSVDCNLPESMHIDIVKHAVDLYRISVSGALYANGQQQEAQQRENARNNYRNEGN